MIENPRRLWRDLLTTWKVEPDLIDETFGELAMRYSDASRHYHNLVHIQNVLETVDNLASIAPNFNAVKLAAWLHDVIYDSKAADNEERSAEYANDLCDKLSIPGGNVVGALILKTKTHDAGSDVDAQVLLDADLAILGSDEATYGNYAESIRLEYAWVPEPQYRTGRAQVLQKFLAKPRIYHHLLDLEKPARRNIAAEIERLTIV